MFYFLRPVSPETPFMYVVACTGHIEKLEEIRLDYPEAIIVETLLEPLDREKAIKKIPPELERAMEAWNRMCDRLPIKIAKVKTCDQYVSTYRRWKRENRSRDFLLEKLVDDVANQPWTHPWIDFGWLFGGKNGTTNAEKLRNGKFEGSKRNDARKQTVDGDDDFNL